MEEKKSERVFKRNLCKIQTGRGEIMHNRMKEAGVQNMSAYIRKMALNGYVIIPKWPDLDQVISLHSRISNNLNQYARKANETGRPNKLYLKKMFWEIAIP